MPKRKVPAAQYLRIEVSRYPEKIEVTELHALRMRSTFRVRDEPQVAAGSKGASALSELRLLLMRTVALQGGHETPLHVPDPLTAFRMLLPRYLNEVKAANSENGKALAFLHFVRNVFEGIAAKGAIEMVPELERYVHVRSGSVVVRGRLDALLGNAIIEFKVDLNGNRLQEAQNQLRQYVSALWFIDNVRTNYILIATDGINVRAYIANAPAATAQKTLIDPQFITLDELDTVNLETNSPEDSFRWLDRYLLWRARLRPDAKTMVEFFGPESAVFRLTQEKLEQAWATAKQEATAVYREWERYLGVVYGAEVGDTDLFLRHTYLATLSKLMVSSYYSAGALPSRVEVGRILRGEAFRLWGIDNFLEEDFFSWVGRGNSEELGLEAAWIVIQALERYDLSQLNEDVLKGLYQGLVDPTTRHDLGEYYTPDWLADLVVHRVMQDPTARTLDPACGSGTFLASAIRAKRSNLTGSPERVLNDILDNVVGFDIHPLAVLTAKANYLMALGDLIRYKTGRIHIPVYLANTIWFPTATRDVTHGIRVFRYPVSRQMSLGVPEEAVAQGWVGEGVEATSEYAQLVAKGSEQPNLATFKQYLARRAPKSIQASEAALQVLHETAGRLTKLILNNKDSIYPYIIKNVYRPATIGKFRLIIGNPPWLRFSDLHESEYRDAIKDMIIAKHELLASDESNLMTAMELATLFVAKAASEYLKEGGRLAFVMPRAIYTGDQHDRFRRAQFQPRVEFVEVLDLQNLNPPVFNVPTCVVVVQRAGSSPPTARAIVISGQIADRNQHYEAFRRHVADNAVRMENRTILLLRLGSRSAWSYDAALPCGDIKLRDGPSPYQGRFVQGASLVPRPLWWVDIKANRLLGVNPGAPDVRTAKRAKAQSKKPWNDVDVEGPVEADYLFASILGSDILPFSHLPPRPVVLPIQAVNDRYVMMSRTIVSSRGHLSMAQWLDRAEKLWSDRRGNKADAMTLYQRLDYWKILTSQDPRKRYHVLYNYGGSYLACAVFDQETQRTFDVLGTTLRFNGFVSDTKSIHFATDDENEAHYLSAVLNSRVVDAIFTPFQSRGQWGERDIAEKPLEIGFPEFDGREPLHLRLANASRMCAVEASACLAELIAAHAGDAMNLTPHQLGRWRSTIRERIATEMDVIDLDVCRLLAAKSI